MSLRLLSPLTSMLSCPYLTLVVVVFEVEGHFCLKDAVAADYGDVDKVKLIGCLNYNCI